MNDRVASQLARLDTSHINYGGGGRSSVANLSPQDVAAALAFVPDAVGRYLLEHIYWPDGSIRTRRKLDALVLDIQLEEFNRRERVMDDALSDLVTCEPANRKRAETLYAEGHAQRWPNWVVKTEPLTFAEPFTLMRSAVLAEMEKPKRCSDCHGKDLTDRKGNPVTCERCLGRGTIEYGPTWRARRLKMTHQSFNERWKAPYEWLLQNLREELSIAEAGLVRCLRAA